MDTASEVPRDLFGRPLTEAGLSSEESEDETSSDIADSQIPDNSTAANKSAITWRRCSAATSLLQMSVKEHQKRILEGEEARRSLKEWSERVLGNVEDEALETAMNFDAEQAEQDSTEAPSKSKVTSTGLGAALKQHWKQTVEEEVQARLQKVLQEHSKEASEQIQRLKKEKEELKVEVARLRQQLKQTN